MKLRSIFGVTRLKESKLFSKESVEFFQLYFSCLKKLLPPTTSYVLPLSVRLVSVRLAVTGFNREVCFNIDLSFNYDCMLTWGLHWYRFIVQIDCQININCDDILIVWNLLQIVKRTTLTTNTSEQSYTTVTHGLSMSPRVDPNGIFHLYHFYRLASSGLNNRFQICQVWLIVLLGVTCSHCESDVELLIISLFTAIRNFKFFCKKTSSHCRQFCEHVTV